MSEPTPAECAGPDADDDAAAGDATHRMCAVTRVVKPIDDMIRFVAAPDGTVTPDLAQKLPGRGVWVTASAVAVAEAARRNVFAKSMKRQIKIPDALAEGIERQLLNRLRQTFAFANKAGAVTMGFTKVDEAVIKGRVAVLVQASDAADDGRDRLAQKFRAICATQNREAVISRFLSIDDLSLAIGRSNVVHAAIAEGGPSRAFIREGLRLDQFRRTEVP